MNWIGTNGMNAKNVKKYTYTNRSNRYLKNDTYRVIEFKIY